MTKPSNSEVIEGYLNGLEFALQVLWVELNGAELESPEWNALRKVQSILVRQRDYARRPVKQQRDFELNHSLGTR